jgi:hypothetical protein
MRGRSSRVKLKSRVRYKGVPHFSDASVSASAGDWPIDCRDCGSTHASLAKSRFALRHGSSAITGKTSEQAEYPRRRDFDGLHVDDREDLGDAYSPLIACVCPLSGRLWEAGIDRGIAESSQRGYTEKTFASTG